MAESRPILSFAEPAAVRRMPSEFRALASHGYLAASQVTPDISFRVSWIGDWWFTRLSSKGDIHVKTEVGTHPPRDYALITLPLAGIRPPKMLSRDLGQTGCITVTRWDEIYEFENSGVAHYLVAHIPTHFLLSDSEQKFPAAFSTTVSAFHGTGQVLSATLRALANASEQCNRKTQKSLYALLPDCSRIIRSVLAQPDSSSGYSERSTRMERIREYMEEHFTNPFLTSEEVAEACGLSRRQFYRECNLSGESFAETLKKIRIEQAAAELNADPRASIGEIAYRCGYIKIATFNRAFHQHYGCCPREFRHNF